MLRRDERDGGCSVGGGGSFFLVLTLFHSRPWLPLKNRHTLGIERDD